MDGKQRKQFWIFPLHGLKSRLEKLVTESDSFESVTSDFSLINGTANINFKDQNGARYSISLEREMPRYSIDLSYGEKASEKAVIELKDYIRSVCAGEACTDVTINKKCYGAIPLDQHNL